MEYLKKRQNIYSMSTSEFNSQNVGLVDRKMDKMHATPFLVMNLPEAPSGYQWRIRKVWLMGVDSTLLALILEPDTWFRRIIEDSYSGLTIYAEDATDEFFEQDAERVLTNYYRRNTVEPNIKKYVGKY